MIARLMAVMAFALPVIDAMAKTETILPPKVVPAMSRADIEAGLKSHDHAPYIKQGWIRDLYITVGPDNGAIYMRAIDPDYATSGWTEAQKFKL